MDQATIDKQKKIRKEQAEFYATIKELSTITTPRSFDALDHTCVWCDQLIPGGSKYFWGRHGGEWHLQCYEEHNPITTGMWINE